MLKQHTLAIKLSKCNYSVHCLEYLRHIISKERVSTNPSKTKATHEWPKLVTIKKLRGLFRLSCYYKRFIKNYAFIRQSLNALLKKNAKFICYVEVQSCFDALIEALLSALVLALPNFNK